jgi:hypothetical protein
MDTWLITINRQDHTDMPVLCTKSFGEIYFRDIHGHSDSACSQIDYTYTHKVSSIHHSSGQNLLYLTLEIYSSEEPCLDICGNELPLKPAEPPSPVSRPSTQTLLCPLDREYRSVSSSLASHPTPVSRSLPTPRQLWCHSLR